LYHIRQTTIKYLKQIAKARRQRINSVEIKLKDAEVCCGANPSDASKSEVMILRTEYEKLIDCKTKGAIVRSRVTLYENAKKKKHQTLP